METSDYDSEIQRALRLFIVLARCMNSVTDHARDDVLRHNLKPSEFGVLELLYHKGSLPLSQIAEQVLLTTPGITHVIDQLEKKALVERVACPQDRRVWYAALTEAGRDKIAAIFPEHARCIRDAVSGLSPEEQEQAIALLRKMGLAAKAFRPRRNTQQVPDPSRQHDDGQTPSNKHRNTSPDKQ